MMLFAHLTVDCFHEVKTRNRISGCRFLPPKDSGAVGIYGAVTPKRYFW